MRRPLITIKDGYISVLEIYYVLNPLLRSLELLFMSSKDSIGFDLMMTKN